VLKVDTDCDKYNKIEVSFEKKVYLVTISRSDCQNKVYKVGQIVTLIKYKDNDTLVWPEAQVEWLPIVILAAFALAYYTNKEKFQKTQNTKLDTGLAK
jgi:hypothetical protein